MVEPKPKPMVQLLDMVHFYYFQSKFEGICQISVETLYKERLY